MRTLAVKTNGTIGEREQRVVAADTHIAAGMEMRTALTHDDVACSRGLAAKDLDAETLDSESRPLRVLPPAFL